MQHHMLRHRRWKPTAYRREKKRWGIQIIAGAAALPLLSFTEAFSGGKNSSSPDGLDEFFRGDPAVVLRGDDSWCRRVFSSSAEQSGGDIPIMASYLEAFATFLGLTLFGQAMLEPEDDGLSQWVSVTFAGFFIYLGYLCTVPVARYTAINMANSSECVAQATNWLANSTWSNLSACTAGYETYQQRLVARDLDASESAKGIEVAAARNETFWVECFEHNAPVFQYICRFLLMGAVFIAFLNAAFTYFGRDRAFSRRVSATTRDMRSHG